MESTNNKRKIFVSYSTAMEDNAVLACAELNKYGIEVWRDKTSIPKGKDGWVDAIDSGILSSDLMVVLLNEKSAASPQVIYEWSFALGAGKTVIGVRFEECDIHSRLMNTQLFMNEFMNGQRPWGMLTASILSTDIGTDFRQKVREFLLVSTVVYEKYDIQKMKENTLTNPIRFNNEDYNEIVNNGAQLLQSYTNSSTPIKTHYLSDIISFKSTFYNFVNQNWLICDSQPISEIRSVPIASITRSLKD